MKNIFKPYSLLMHLLAILMFFFLGIIYAGIVDAGKGQMLAGGAIVLGYGVVGAFIGFCISVFVSYKSNRKTIFNTNIVLALLIVALWGYFALKYRTKQKDKQEKENLKIEQPKQTTAPEAVNDTAMLFAKKSVISKVSMGLGIFTPNIHENTVFYFYGNPNFEKPVQEHTPIDSITFKKTSYGGELDIATAPPWLVPHHLKLDYGILHFKVQSITNGFVEIEVNSKTKQTAYVNKYDGTMKYWPNFLLGVNSVEFLEPNKHTIYVKPLDHAGTINTAYSFMQPIRITNQWMYVNLLGDDFVSVGKGWIRWKKNNQFLIKYSLLS